MGSFLFSLYKPSSSTPGLLTDSQSQKFLIIRLQCGPQSCLSSRAFACSEEASSPRHYVDLDHNPILDPHRLRPYNSYIIYPLMDSCTPESSYTGFPRSRLRVIRFTGDMRNIRLHSFPDVKMCGKSWAFAVDNRKSISIVYVALDGRRIRYRGGEGVFEEQTSCLSRQSSIVCFLLPSIFEACVRGALDRGLTEVCFSGLRELDVLFLGAIMPRYCSVSAKRSLKYMPILGQFST